MPLTIDEIAYALNSWCTKEGDHLRKYFSLQGGWESEAYSDFNRYLIPANVGFGLSASKSPFDDEKPFSWVFTDLTETKGSRIVAELACESIENHKSFESQVDNRIDRLSDEHFNEQYKGATKCIISFYFNLEKRNFLHKNEFIEIYNGSELGCAIKRIK
jgi:hypothetical protein